MKKIQKPNNFGNLVTLERNEDILILENLTNTIINSYYINSYQGDDKVINKFIKHVESKFRSSDQYLSYVSYIKNEFSLYRCSILGNITTEYASIELHHYPLTLYEITETLIIHAFKNKIKINSFILINMLLDLHYKNLIGLVPLSETVHELVHSKNDNNIVIPVESIFGNIQKFIEIYKNDMSNETIERYNKRIEKSNTEGNYDLIKKNKGL